MNKIVFWLVASVALTWLMLLVASLLRTRGWTLPGMGLAFGNRDDLPAASAIAGRAERAARNMVENLVLFAALLLAAEVAGVIGAGSVGGPGGASGVSGASGAGASGAAVRSAASSANVLLGAQIFFWARLAYFALYLAGIRVLRTVVWGVSLVGLGMIGWAAKA